MIAERNLRTPQRRPLLQRLRVLLRRAAKGLFALFGCYFAVVVVGLIPVNNDFQPASDGIEVFIVSSSVHSDIVIPIKNVAHDWSREFKPEDFRSGRLDGTHIAVGWGDKGFFIGTPTWADLKVSTVANALLWPSDTCLHVQCYNLSDLPHDARSVRLSEEQYRRLVEFVRRAFVRDDQGNVFPIADACYGNRDAFYQSRGVYHCFNTCNCWVGNGLQTAGVRTGWFTPMPRTVYWYLPR